MTWWKGDDNERLIFGWTADLKQLYLTSTHLTDSDDLAAAPHLLLEKPNHDINSDVWDEIHLRKRSAAIPPD